MGDNVNVDTHNSLDELDAIQRLKNIDIHGRPVAVELAQVNIPNVPVLVTYLQELRGQIACKMSKYAKYLLILFLK
jgi:hypothetical protein